MKMAKEDKQRVREQYEKVWHEDAKMVDYCTNRTSGYIMLDDVMVTCDKPHIQTDFWFGEHTYDYDEVCETAHKLSTDEQYFIDENLRGCDAHSILEALEGRDRWGYETMYDVYVVGHHYSSQDDDCQLGYVTALRLGTDPQRHFAVRNGVQPYRKATDGEIEALKTFYADEVAKFEKRLRAYLKRYGLSKCNYGVYWADR